MIDQANTIGTIAQRLGVTIHRVDRVTRTRGIEPMARAGTSRIFDESAVAKIASEIREIDQRRAAQRALSCSRGGQAQ